MSDKNVFYIGIDASIASTAISYWFPEDKKWEHYSYMKNLKMTKWPNIVASCVNFKGYNILDSDDNAESEAAKMLAANNVTDMMYNDVKKYVDLGYTFYGCIEGYSFASSAGPLIDLVTLGTLIRYKLGTLSPAPLYIMTPTQLKSFAAQSTYPKPDKKNQPYRNYQGIAGGKFQKHQMMRALLDCADLTGVDFVERCRDRWDEINESKTVKAPLPDIVDSVWAAWKAYNAFKD